MNRPWFRQAAVPWKTTATQTRASGENRVSTKLGVLQSDGAGSRRQAWRGGAAGLRLPGDDQRRGPAPEAARAGIHRGGVAVLLRVLDVLADDGGGDRGLRGGVGVLWRDVRGAYPGQPQAGGG